MMTPTNLMTDDELRATADAALVLLAAMDRQRVIRLAEIALLAIRMTEPDECDG